jgi:hypothetical protein
MTKFLRIIGVFLALLLVGGAAYFAYWAAKEILRLYSEAGSDFKLGLLTALISLVGVVWSVIYQRRKELLALQFDRKREAYGVFFDLLFDFIDANKSGLDPMDDPTFQTKWTDLTKRMMIWGGAKTINAFNAFQAAGHVAGDDIKSTSNQVEKLMREFRVDLGHNDSQLKPFALTKLMVRGDEHYKFH